MCNLSDELRARLTALAADFSKQLPVRLTEIRVLFEELDADFTQTGLGKLRLMLHKLAGSGATFGFDELSVQSKSLEKILGVWVDKGETPTDDELNAFNSRLKDVESAWCEDAGLEELDGTDQTEPEVRNQQVSEVRRPKKIIYLADRDDLMAADLSDQIGFYGYEVLKIFFIGELQEALENGDRCLLLIHTFLLEEDPGIAKQLKIMKNRYGSSFGIIFVSKRDDIEIRLQSVRAGGDAFFLLPLDIGRLIDKIDALTSRVESSPYHILIVDDDPEQVSYYAFLLQQAGMITSVASDPMKVLNVLIEAKPELILMDMYMPGCNGVELSSLIRQHEAFVSLPIIFLSFETDRDKQMEAMCIGGDDFLMKPIKPDHLISIVSSRAERNRGLRYFMERDSLTGLLNHTNLKEQLNREIYRCERTGSTLCFAMIDADKFKLVNDTYGHLTGDRVLKSLARLLQDRLRRTDIIGRYGGEEFGVILLNTGAEQAFTIMDQIRESFSKIKHQAEGNEFFVTFSCGIASYPEIGEAAEINSAADKAMYEAKEKGRNMVRLFSHRENPPD